jgi:hypothetical protein
MAIPRCGRNFLIVHGGGLDYDLDRTRVAAQGTR